MEYEALRLLLHVDAPYNEMRYLMETGYMFL